jgi:hypothetical protein
MKLTKRQKLIASCINPYWKGFSTRKEVKRIKLMARGHYWIDKEFEEFVVFSPGGKRTFFTYNFSSGVSKQQQKKWFDDARRCAYYWAKGKLKKAIELNRNTWINYYKDVLGETSTVADLMVRD